MFPYTLDDFCALTLLTRSGGESFAVGLDRPLGDRAFRDVGGGPTEEAGRAAFDNFKCPLESPDLERIGGAYPYRVIVVKTRDGGIGKILVVDLVLSGRMDTPDGASCDGYCGQMMFEWAYQPDADGCFE